MEKKQVQKPYLEECLDQIQSLPANLKAQFDLVKSSEELSLRNIGLAINAA